MDLPTREGGVLLAVAFKKVVSLVVRNVYSTV